MFIRQIANLFIFAFCTVLASYADADELEVQFLNPVLSGRIPRQILESEFTRLGGSLPRQPPQEYKPSAEVIAQILMGGPEDWPANWSISAENFASVVEVVRQYMTNNLPIEGVTFWGGARNYGLGSRLGVDLADLMALLRYRQLHYRIIEAGYAPGLKARVVFEDLGRRFMGLDTTNMRMRAQIYGEQMRRLSKVVCACIEFAPESELIKQAPVPRPVLNILGKESAAPNDETFLTLASKAEGIIFRYLRASENPETLAPETSEDQAGFERVARLPEFVAIEEMGFKGGIPKNQRQYVRNRTKVRLGGGESLSAAEIDQHVAKYFAQGFARALFNLRGGTQVDHAQNGKVIPALSFSFLPYPPGTPASMNRMRIELKATKGLRSSDVPCWGGCGVFVWNGTRAELTVSPFAASGAQTREYILVRNSRGQSISLDAIIMTPNETDGSDPAAQECQRLMVDHEMDSTE